MIRERLRPKHQRLVLACYPRGRAQEKRPNSSELSYLLYYVSSRPTKLPKVTTFLANRASHYAASSRSANLQVTLAIISAIVDKCHADLNLFAESVLDILIVVLKANDLALAQQAQSCLASFAAYHDGGLLVDDNSDFVSKFETLIALYSNCVFYPKQPNPHLWILVGLDASAALAASPALSTPLGRYQINAILNTILHSLLPFSPLKLADLIRSLHSNPSTSPSQSVINLANNSTNQKQKLNNLQLSQPHLSPTSSLSDNTSEFSNLMPPISTTTTTTTTNVTNNINTTSNYFTSPTSTPVINSPSNDLNSSNISKENDLLDNSKNPKGFVINNSNSNAKNFNNKSISHNDNSHLSSSNDNTTISNSNGNIKNSSKRVSKISTKDHGVLANFLHDNLLDRTISNMSLEFDFLKHHDTSNRRHKLNSSTSSVTKNPESNLNYTSHHLLAPIINPPPQPTPSFSDANVSDEIGSHALSALVTLFRTQNLVQIRHSAAAWCTFIQSNTVIFPWCMVLIQSIVHWVPVQLRFVVLQVILESIGLNYSPFPPSNSHNQLLLLCLINGILRSNLNLVGLSVLDVWKSLLQFALSVIFYNNSTDPTRIQDQKISSQKEQQAKRTRAQSVNGYARNISQTFFFSNASSTNINTKDRRSKNINPNSPAPLNSEFLINAVIASIGALANHIYYSEQTADIISEILKRLRNSAVDPNLLPENPSELDSNSIPPETNISSDNKNNINNTLKKHSASTSSSSSLSTNSYTNSSPSVMAICFGLRQICEIYAVASIISGGVKRDPVHYSAWSDTFWILRCKFSTARILYLRAYTSFLKYDVKPYSYSSTGSKLLSPTNSFSKTDNINKSKSKNKERSSILSEATSNLNSHLHLDANVMINTFSNKGIAVPRSGLAFNSMSSAFPRNISDSCSNRQYYEVNAESHIHNLAVGVYRLCLSSDTSLLQLAYLNGLTCVLASHIAPSLVLKFISMFLQLQDDIVYSKTLEISSLNRLAIVNTITVFFYSFGKSISSANLQEYALSKMQELKNRNIWFDIFSYPPASPQVIDQMTENILNSSINYKFPSLSFESNPESSRPSWPCDRAEILSAILSTTQGSQTLFSTQSVESAVNLHWKAESDSSSVISSYGALSNGGIIISSSVPAHDENNSNNTKNNTSLNGGGNIENELNSNDMSINSKNMANDNGCNSPLKHNLSPAVSRSPLIPPSQFPIYEALKLNSVSSRNSSMASLGQNPMTTATALAAALNAAKFSKNNKTKTNDNPQQKSPYRAKSAFFRSDKNVNENNNSNAKNLSPLRKKASREITHLNNDFSNEYTSSLYDADMGLGASSINSRARTINLPYEQLSLDDSSNANNHLSGSTRIRSLKQLNAAAAAASNFPNLDAISVFQKNQRNS